MVNKTLSLGTTVEKKHHHNKIHIAMYRFLMKVKQQLTVIVIIASVFILGIIVFFIVIGVISFRKGFRSSYTCTSRYNNYTGMQS